MPQLRVLSLVDNPCVAATPDYRARVRQKKKGPAVWQ